MPTCTPFGAGSIAAGKARSASAALGKELVLSGDVISTLRDATQEGEIEPCHGEKKDDRLIDR